MSLVRLVYTWAGEAKAKVEYVTDNGVSIVHHDTKRERTSLTITYTVPDSRVRVVGSFLSFHGRVLRGLELRIFIDGREQVLAQSDEERHYWRTRGLWTVESDRVEPAERSTAA